MRLISFLALTLAGCSSMNAWDRPLPGRPGRPGNTFEGVFFPVQTSPDGTWIVGVTDEDGSWRWASDPFFAPTNTAELASTRGVDLFVTTSSLGMEVHGIGALSRREVFRIALPKAEFGQVGAVISAQGETRVISAARDQEIIISRFDAATGAPRSVRRWPVASVSKVLAAVSNTDQRLTIAYASSFETPLRLLEVDDEELRFDVPVPHSDGGPGYLLKILDLQKKGTGTTLVAHSPDGSLGFWEWDSQGGFRGLNLRTTSGASLNASGLNDLDVLLMRRPDGRRVIEYRTGAYWNFLGSVELPHEVCAKDCQLGVTRHGGVILAGADPRGGYRAWAVPPPKEIARALDVATGWTEQGPRLQRSFLANFNQYLVAHVQDTRVNPRHRHLH